jgi:hypothetical protein
MSILEILLYVVHLPDEAGKLTDEGSVVGQSEWDRKSRRFWKWFAWIGTAIILGIPLVVWILWFAFTD